MNRKHTTKMAALAAVAALAVGATSATASALITSAQIKDNSVQSRDIRNGTLKVEDLSAAARNALKGAQGPQGLAGPQGAQGPAGSPGVPGPASLEGFKFDVVIGGTYMGSYMYTDKAENGDPLPGDGYYVWVPA